MKLEIKHLTKKFGKDIILSNFSLNVIQPEIISVLGPSGCGKTTLLNMIASLEEISSGEVLINKSNRLGYMMQDNSLLDWRTLEENASLGLEVFSDEKQKEKLDYYFDIFELKNQKDVYPSEASAGMKQRVALIRTFLINPTLILLDEPFSNLDFDIKLKIQNHILKYHSQIKSTILLVTHDIEDAIALSDRVLILSDKPTKIKKEIRIDLGISKRNPIEARKSPKFREYFVEIWDNLKYLQEYIKND